MESSKEQGGIIHDKQSDHHQPAVRQRRQNHWQKSRRKLGIPYYDKELVDQVAKESGFSHEFIEEIGEYASVTSSFLFNIAVSAHPMGLIDTMSVSDKLYVCQTNVIRDLAEKGPCVIVGRCADFILKDRPTRCISSSIPTWNIAPSALCACTARRSRPRRSVCRKKDSKRKVYYKHYTNCNWGEAENYDLCLDSGTLGVDKCADIICDVALMP